MRVVGVQPISVPQSLAYVLNTAGSKSGVDFDYLLRTAQQIQYQLSQMADQKASILMGATFVVFTIVVGQARSGAIPISLGVLAISAFLSAMCAVYAVLPTIGQGTQPARPNKLFFGHFTAMDEDQWAEAVLDVPPEAFDPPPRVDSAIVRMVPLAEPPAIDLARFSTMVQVAFSQRRKILRNTLGRWLEEQGFTGEFDLQRRAEEVPVSEYVALAQSLQA